MTQLPTDIEGRKIRILVQRALLVTFIQSIDVCVLPLVNRMMWIDLPPASHSIVSVGAPVTFPHLYLFCLMYISD